MLNVINLIHIIIHCLYITLLQKIAAWNGSKFLSFSWELAGKWLLMHSRMTGGWRAGFWWETEAALQAGSFSCIDHCGFWFRLGIKVKYCSGIFHLTYGSMQCVFQLQFSGAYISAHCSHLSHGVTNKPPKNTHKKQRASRFVLFCSFLWFEWGRFGKNRALVVECVGTQQPFGLKADRGQ